MANTTGMKFGGRKAGTPNKTSHEMRELIQVFLEQQFENLDEIFENLKPRDKINTIIKMFPYILRKQMEMDVNTPQKQDLVHDLSALSPEELEQLESLVEKIRIK